MSGLRGEGESPPCCRGGSRGGHKETGLRDQGWITPEARAGVQMGKEKRSGACMQIQGAQGGEQKGSEEQKALKSISALCWEWLELPGHPQGKRTSDWLP